MNIKFRLQVPLHSRVKLCHSSQYPCPVQGHSRFSGGGVLMREDCFHFCAPHILNVKMFTQIKFFIAKIDLLTRKKLFATKGLNA